MSYSENELINNYLEEVRKKLPEWLKPKKEEVNAILNDLNIQILEEARKIAGGEDPTPADIQQALIQIGSPATIARIYKRRGTPKLYITEELFEFYLRTMLFFFTIVVIINVIIGIFRLFTPPWWEAIGGMISGIWIGCLITTVVITVLFVFFSMQGFLPEDFGVIPSRLALVFPFHLTQQELEETKEYTKERLNQAKEKVKEVIAESKARIEDRFAEVKALRQERLAATELRREQKLLEAKIRREEKLERTKRLREEKKAIAEQKREMKKMQPVTLGELIFGAIAGIIFGLFLVIQPFAAISGFLIEFLDWLKIFGLLIFVGGLFDLVRLIAGTRNYTAQQILLGIKTCYNASFIPLFLFLIDKPGIFPISFFSGGTVLIIPLNTADPAYMIYFWVIILIVVGIIIGMIVNFYKIYKIQKIKRVY
ncbi:MAG: hypothetical protein ACFE8E_03435 [Candidatus Hodarchaeota archaeon]